MSLNLLIDGNFLLNKNIYPLLKTNQLYGYLHRSLENSLNKFTSLYTFNNIFFISDKGKSWRRNIYPNYKANRIKDESIDWEFIYIAYEEFKQNLPKNVKLLELDEIEGDDWIYYITTKYNQQNYSNIIISNDYDVKQLLYKCPENKWINIMINEFSNREKIFLPNGYDLYMNNLKKNKSNDPFELDDNDSIYTFLENLILKREPIASIANESVFTKIVSGDKSDNIVSPLKNITIKMNKRSGIGEKGAIKILNKYKEEFGELNYLDKDFCDNIADLMLESKGYNISYLKEVSTILNLNLDLILFDRIPNNIRNKIENHFNSIFNKVET